MPTDDVFDTAWREVQNDDIRKFSFIEGLARDFGFDEYADRMRQREEARARMLAQFDAEVLGAPNPAEVVMDARRQMIDAQREERNRRRYEEIARLEAQLAEEQQTRGDTLAVPADRPEPEPEIREESVGERVMATPEGLGQVVEKPEPPVGERTAEVGQSFVIPDEDPPVDPSDTLGNMYYMLTEDSDASGNPIAVDDMLGAYNGLMDMARGGNEEAKKYAKNLLTPENLKFMANKFGRDVKGLREDLKAGLDLAAKKSNDIHSDVWTVVKDPFANPFYNQNAFAMTEEQPPEVTYDDTPTFQIDTDLIKGEEPKDALKHAGFDTRSGDDVSLLPSSVFTQGESVPVDDMRLLPKGWKPDE